MARRRSSNRALRTLIALLAVGGCFVVIWFWPLWGSSESGTLPGASTNGLTGMRETNRPEPALQPIIQPGKNALISGDTRVIAEAFKPESLAEPAVPPACTQPATSGPAQSLMDTARADLDLKAGLEAKNRNDLLAARIHLNRALQAGLPAEKDKLVRRELADLAERTIFSQGCIPGDPLVEYYVIPQGDTLGKIGRRFKVNEDLLARINNIANKNQVGQGWRIKVIKGPFHAVIDKSDHVIHLYLQDVYLRTLRVALGSDGSTPIGRWKVSNHQQNPGWTDPRTFKRWHPDDPENPIGEYWIGLEGIDGQAVGQFGYGIHGTIEPQTIGKDVSMGCVRLTNDDIKLVYELLVPEESLVTIND